ncbi:uncharacterized protein LOC129226949 [Uloborus diversus]|uniref:uncharacterized protein LOC129226949 n=1 Tax=Uloborus diversus TaxID=327109 RepID=UPI00240A08CB|nr:uncharacterized protein LOC129226949 [Uloborus diversus]
MEGSSEEKQSPSHQSKESIASRDPSQERSDTLFDNSLSLYTEPSEYRQTTYEKDEEKSKAAEDSKQSSMGEALKSERDFIEYVMSLPSKDSTDHHKSADSVSNRSNKSPAAVCGTGCTTKVGLDHLDNLCKLMEQLSDLRETNSKLQKRVQYLEDLKTLHDMHKEISDEGRSSSDDILASDLRPYCLKKSATESHCPRDVEVSPLGAVRSPSRYLGGRRGRSQQLEGPRRERSKSVGHEDGSEDTKSKRLFPKWSKVKEAFGWESDRKDGMKIKPVGSVRMPRRCSDESHQSSQLQRESPIWSQEYGSLHLSIDDDEDEIIQTDGLKKDKGTSRLEAPIDYIRRQKSTPSPGSDKIASYSENTEMKPKYSTIERDSYISQDLSKFDKEDTKRGKSPWGRVKTIIERRRDSIKRRSVRREHNAEYDASTSKQTPDPNDSFELSGQSECVDFENKSYHHKESIKYKGNKPGPIAIDTDIECCGPRTPSSSPTFQRKSKWTRMKKVLTGKKEDDRDSLSQSTPASPNNARDGNFNFDAIEEISQDSFDENREMQRVGSESHVHQLALNAPSSEIMLQLQRNLSEDFHRKILEWERIRSAGPLSSSPNWDRKSDTNRSRKKSEKDDKSTKPKLKDLTWLEKELQKIEKEKQRLSKERQKYEERELRLEKLKETVLSAKNTNKKEVLVRTSAGEFRFEGISDAFTKKLYEWETKRGFGPELSTIALLDSSRLTVQPSLLPKSGALQRVISRSESSIADIGQPSHNSSNSLPSLKLPDSMEAVHPSRANSEPDLSTLVALSNERDVSMTSLARHVMTEEHKEVKDDDDNRRTDSETYYGLLEENVLLLEQLRDKEEICRRLEQELEVLDKKVDFMNAHHGQETERYREKLWEMHKPGATPRDVQCCLLTMSQLKKRIETLEKCTEKLRNDRESVEDSFRYHSKQQEDMTLDLLEKMRELQAAGSSADCESPQHSTNTLNVNVVERLQQLSALLVKQTRDLEETLAVKSHQICQLRWELLHRDLSTAKLETELHTQSAHRKRSHYAHFRSHSSEETSSLMPPLIPPENLKSAQSNIVADIYGTGMQGGEFKATQLTTTVQKLNQELLKLAMHTEHSGEDIAAAEENQNFSNYEIPSRKSKEKDRHRQITVRRSSADNIKVVPVTGDRRHPDTSTTESDDSSEDTYTKVAWRSSVASKTHPENERLLMSHGEHPPRGYVPRRKKLQRVCRSSSSPGRKRSNTFHTQKDLERSDIPQKCQSFRLSREKSILVGESEKAISDKLIHIPNCKSSLAYEELIKLLTKKYQLKKRLTENSISIQPVVTGEDNYGWLREVASDSKIPFLIQMQQNVESQLSKDSKYPTRSMSDKHKNDVASERREHIQKKRSKKRVKSPNHNSSLNAEGAPSPPEFNEHTIGNTDPQEAKFDLGLPRKESLKSEENQENNTVFRPSCETDQCSKDAATVTIQLPKRKPKKTHQPVEEKSDSQLPTFTISIPKKRSLSSEHESSISDNSFRETYIIPQRSNSIENSEDSQAFNDTSKSAISTPDMKDSSYNERNLTIFYPRKDAKDYFQSESISRKRKAESEDDSGKGTSCSEATSVMENSLFQKSSDQIEKPCPYNGRETKSKVQEVSYIKSPSAPQLDWRKVCAKKISREGAPNVRTLIEKYNRVAESQTVQSPVSSNLNSPVERRKVSYTTSHCLSDSSISPQSLSVPNTPNVVSASIFYNPLVFKPTNLDLFSSTPPESPMSRARNEALIKAKQTFMSSQDKLPQVSDVQESSKSEITNIRTINTTSIPGTYGTKENIPAIDQHKHEDDSVSNCSMDSMSLVVFRTGESCKESRLSKRSVENPKQEQANEPSSLKPSKSLSNSSLFKSVLSSDFKVPSSLLRLKRSKRKKDMGAVSHLCRQSLLLSEDSQDTTPPPSHKSCPSSPELKSKGSIKPNWFQRNLFRHK